MRPPTSPGSRRRARAVVALVSVTLLVGVLPHAGAADPRLDQAMERRLAVQAELDELLNRIGTIEAEISDAQASLAALERQEAEQAVAAEEAAVAVTRQATEAFKRGGTDPMLAFIASGSPAEAAEQARLLGRLAHRSQSEREVAQAARTRIEATATDIDRVTDALSTSQTELETARGEVTALLAEAQADEDDVRQVIAAEEAARAAEEARRAEERRREAEAAAAAAAAEEAAAVPDDEPTSEDDGSDDSAEADDAPGDDAATDDDADAGAEGDDTDSDSEDSDDGADDVQVAGEPDPEPEPEPDPEPEPEPEPATGGIACPMGQPRTYSDTYGAPRGEGRTHQGTDILAPMGTPIYAYESGTISRMSTNRLGGITLYLAGDSGTTYYYAHLQGYVGGLAAGQQVGTGQHIAFNGDTGNATGIPHLHIEVMPGGGGGVNPYPYMVRACG